MYGSTWRAIAAEVSSIGAGGSSASGSSTSTRRSKSVMCRSPTPNTWGICGLTCPITSGAVSRSAACAPAEVPRVRLPSESGGLTWHIRTSAASGPSGEQRPTKSLYLAGMMENAGWSSPFLIEPVGCIDFHENGSPRCWSGAGSRRMKAPTNSSALHDSRSSARRSRRPYGVPVAWPMYSRDPSGISAGKSSMLIWRPARLPMGRESTQLE